MVFLAPVVNPGHAGDGVPRSHHRSAATTRHHVRRPNPDHRQRATPTVRRPHTRQDRNRGTHPEMVRLATKTPSNGPPMPLSPQVRAPKTRTTAVVLVAVGLPSFLDFARSTAL